jgi:succinate-acetate transporter protein
LRVAYGEEGHNRLLGRGNARFLGEIGEKEKTVSEDANRSREEISVAPAEPGYADPAPLGLAAFALTTFIFSMVNAGIIPQGEVPSQQIINLYLPLALIYGGFAQLIAGVLEFRNKNTFGLTAFTSYGAFWIGLAIMNIFARQFDIAPSQLVEAQGYFFLGWTIFTAILLIGSFGVNVALITVFVLLFITFVLLTIGDLLGGPEGSGGLFINLAGYLGIATALAAWYFGGGRRD